MSTLEKKDIEALKIIKEKCMAYPTKLTNELVGICDGVFTEYDSRKKRLGEKENLSKDNK